MSDPANDRRSLAGCLIGLVNWLWCCLVGGAIAAALGWIKLW